MSIIPYKPDPVEDEPSIELGSWRAFAVGQPATNHFIGINLADGHGRVCSPIESWDPVSRVGITRSGRRYHLADARSNQHEGADLTFDAWLQANGIERSTVLEISDDYAAPLELGEEFDDKTNCVEIAGMKFVNSSGQELPPGFAQMFAAALVSSGQAIMGLDGRLRMAPDVPIDKVMGMDVHLDEDGLEASLIDDDDPDLQEVRLARKRNVQ